MSRTSTVVSVTLMLLASVFLSACTPDVTAPSKPASPSPVATPTPTPEAADPIASVTALVARPEALELRGPDGAVVESLDYMSQAADAVAVLSRVFDGPPIDESYDGGNHYPDGVSHVWGAFKLQERHYDEARRVAEGYDYLVWPRWAVYFDGPDSGGVTLSTVQGHRAGDDWLTVAADPDFQSDLWTCVGTPIESAQISVPVDFPDRVTVVVVSSEDGTTVDWIGAPQMEADGCA